jgi:hypothetical protein
MKNALIHAQDRVDNMLIVESSITTQFVLVYLGTLAMRLHIANCYLPLLKDHQKL